MYTYEDGMYNDNLAASIGLRAVHNDGLHSRLSSLTASCAVILLGATSFVFAKPLDPTLHQHCVPNLLPKQVITPGGAPCGQNDATNRACWKNSCNISTDYKVADPPAFNTVNVQRRVGQTQSWSDTESHIHLPVLLPRGRSSIFLLFRPQYLCLYSMSSTTHRGFS
ncbi:hypothetical protein B0T13DRAFT_1841 [Neurospora crassa]|nr:hypothetical protein B0T13DRAFT_1841 [Neurospora crassa]